MPRALKVYRTPIGFHDAYVAAPSQKAALEAWGTEKDLFARGAAEVVTDPAFTEKPLVSPGKVIRLPRGSVAEHMRAAGKAEPRSRSKAPPPDKDDPSAKPAHRETKAPPMRKPKPPPSRAALSKAEDAVAAFAAEAEREIEALREREAALRQERDRMLKRQRDQAARLEVALAKAKERYDAAIDRWSTED